MKYFLPVFAFITITGACQKMRTAGSDVPKCIQSAIDSLKNEPTRFYGTVEEFEFQGRLVYAFGPAKNIRDGATLIKSADCKNLCYIGGFAGPRNSNCNGENFYEKAVLKRKIWGEE